MIVIDLDHFKRVNDVYGHLNGDEVLKLVATCLKESIRSIDYVCRYGGDEYIAVLTEQAEIQLQISIENQMKKIAKVIENINERIRSYLVTLTEKNTVTVTVSAGLTYYTEDVNDFNDMFQKADECLYIVKKSGRNNIAFKSHSHQKPTLYNERK